MDTTATWPGRRSGTQYTDEGLTERQDQIVRFIRTALQRTGYSPSMREIGQAVGLASTSSVAHQINVLEGLGVLRRDPHRPRTFHLAHQDPDPSLAAEPASEVAVPLLGRIAAGAPITAEEHIEDVLSLPRQLVGEGRLFALTVSGQSMINARIQDGDTVVVRTQPQAESGDIVAAMIDGEATIKRLRRTANRTWLMPENPEYPPIPAERARILGRVVAVLRSL